MPKTRLHVALLIVPLVLMPVVVSGQGLLDRVKDAAKKTSAGKQVRKLGADAQMLDATTVELDSKNLPTVQIGTLKLGISSVDIKNGVAVRLKLYLFNPAAQNVTVPMPPGDLFVLVDQRGRKYEPISAPSVKDLPAESAEIVVPAVERVELTLLFESLPADALLGTLKVGSAGMITGIPMNTSATPAAATGSSTSPWKQ